jgi:hypothetical protein
MNHIEETMLERIIKKTINNPRLMPSNEINLLGMDYDIHHAFDSSDIFDALEINKTGSKECMFDIRLTVSPSVIELEQVELGLQAAWDFIAYSNFAESSYTISNNNANFTFVTVSLEGKFYVTGKIIISGLTIF